MNLIDFIIGLSLMNAMPHFVLGTWKAKMLSGFGTGNLPNIFWSLTNFVISISLFIYKYGIEGLFENGIYLGALVIVVVFFLTSHFWFAHYYKNESKQQ